MRRYVSTEDAAISELERRVKELTEERDELAERVGTRAYMRTYRAQKVLLEAERQHSRILGERFDALRSQLPDAGSKVERFKQAQMRGEKACL